jgi:hypothetical protein
VKRTPCAWFYEYGDAIYILPPENTENTDEPSSFGDAIARAVIEAGFATEELRHCIRELYECLYLRMLYDSSCPSPKEHDAMDDARRFLGLSG